MLTENYGALNLLHQLMGNEENTHVIFGSSFPRDQEYIEVYNICLSSSSFSFSIHIYMFLFFLLGLLLTNSENYRVYQSHRRRGKTNQSKRLFKHMNFFSQSVAHLSVWFSEESWSEIFIHKKAVIYTNFRRSEKFFTFFILTIRKPFANLRCILL